ncbi:MAG: hypothetical protein AAFX86_15065 [Pseudomonadota bacterium]
MTPHVREAEQASVAVNQAPKMVVPINAIDPNTHSFKAKVQAPETAADTGPSLLSKRRRRWARLSNR